MFDEYTYKNSQQNTSKPNPTTHKKLCTMAKKNSSQVHKEGSTYTNQCDTSLQQKKTWGTQYDLLNRFRKNV